MLFFLRISWHHFCVSSLIGSMIVLFKVLLVMPKQFLVAGFLKIILPFLPLTPLNSPFIAGALHSNNCRSHTLVYNRYGDLTVTYSRPTSSFILHILTLGRRLYVAAMGCGWGDRTHGENSAEAYPPLHRFSILTRKFSQSTVTKCNFF